MGKLDKKSIFLILIIVLVASASFGLGRLSIIEKYRAQDEVSIIVPKLKDLSIDESKFQFVASKTGTKYYPMGCKSAERIKEENRVYFETEEEAKAAGLEATATCSMY